MACGSGMKAAMTAAAAIASGAGNLYLAGGTESMSLAPYLIPGARQGLRMGNKEIVDHMVFDALTDAFDGSHMGITAENIARKYGISREEQDEFAIASQQKAIRAVDTTPQKPSSVALSSLGPTEGNLDVLARGDYVVTFDLAAATGGRSLPSRSRSR